MERVGFLPLGSIVLLRGGIKKIMIISRGITATNGDKEVYFDYGAIMYPEGMVDNKMAYFNHEDISKIVFEGYRDIDDENIVDIMNDYLETVELERGSRDNFGSDDE